MYSEADLNKRGFVAVAQAEDRHGNLTCAGCAFDVGGMAAQVRGVRCLEAPCSPHTMGEHVIWVLKDKDAT